MPTSALLLLSLIGSPLQPPVIRRHDLDDTKTVELGRPFLATVRCLPGSSGTLIRDRWILTAAHVARDLSRFSPRVEVAGQTRRVTRTVFHPDSVSDGRRPPRTDLALLELDRPVERAEPVGLHRADDEVGREVWVVGYGDYGPAGVEPAFTDGRRRAVSNVVERLVHGHLALVLDPPGPATPFEGVGAPGDSGGSLYIETDGGLRLAGVSFGSVGDTPNAYGVVDLYVRVSAVADWVDGAIEAASGSRVAPPETIDVTDGFPDGPRGALVRGFFEALVQGGEVAQAFEREGRSEEARRHAPASAWIARLERARGDHGPLHPVRLVRTAPEQWAVLCKGSDGWHAVHLFLEDEAGTPKLHDWDRRPEPPPDDLAPAEHPR